MGRDESELARELEVGRAKLLAEREKRIHPGLDDKVLVAWNGLMIDALAQAAGALDEPRYLAAAQRAADFILHAMRRPDGRLLHTWRRVSTSLSLRERAGVREPALPPGKATLDAYLDDYAALANSLVRLYEADFNDRWIDDAVSLAEIMLKQFADPAGGALFFTASDHETLITRQKDLYDNAVPSGNALAAMALLRLGKLTGRSDFLSAAESILRSAAALMRQSPRAMGQMLQALDMLLGPTPEIVIVGQPQSPDTAAALAALRHRYVPNRLVACRPPDALAAGSPALAPLFAGKQLAGPEPGVFICENFACQAPLFGKDAALAAWELLAGRNR